MYNQGYNLLAKWDEPPSNNRVKRIQLTMAHS